MKKILFLFMFLPLLASAQTPSITGCLGLTFGMSQNEAIHQLASKIDTTGIKLFDIKTSVSASGVSNFYFADKIFNNLFLLFYDGKLYQIMLVKQFTDESKMESVFSDLKSSYKIKYNKPDFENDSAIAWKDIYNNLIMISYDTDRKRLLIVYVDDEIYKQVSLEKEKDL